MQYHYVVMFDDETKKWAVCSDIEPYLPDGNVWDEERDQGGDYGWFYPYEDTEPLANLIDERCWVMLDALVSIWPAVDTEPM